MKSEDLDETEGLTVEEEEEKAVEEFQENFNYLVEQKTKTDEARKK